MGGRHHQSDGANQPPESAEQEDPSHKRNGRNQQDGGNPKQSLQQLLDAANQIIDGFADQQHDVDLLGQLMQQDGESCSSSQHQHNNRQLPQHGARGEAKSSGVVVGGTKHKIGIPIELEGRLYRVNGTVSGVQLL